MEKTLENFRSLFTFIGPKSLVLLLVSLKKLFYYSKIKKKQPLDKLVRLFEQK